MRISDWSSYLGSSDLSAGCDACEGNVVPAIISATASAFLQIEIIIYSRIPRFAHPRCGATESFPVLDGLVLDCPQIVLIVEWTGHGGNRIRALALYEEVEPLQETALPLEHVLRVLHLVRSEEHTYELQLLMPHSLSFFLLK